MAVMLVTWKVHDWCRIYTLACQKQYLSNGRARIINEICKITYQQLKTVTNHMERIEQSKALWNMDVISKLREHWTVCSSVNDIFRCHGLFPSCIHPELLNFKIAHDCISMLSLSFKLCINTYVAFKKSSINHLNYSFVVSWMSSFLLTLNK